ncbi:MAG: alpha/beta hydrolase fold domain-containing protein [Bacteroidales bacterium]|nr:alpha/beta hydrolase fold domain-containing protein [Bacteroidales bacterium]
MCRRKLSYEFLKYLLLVVIIVLPHFNCSRTPKERPGMETYIFKTIGHTKLKLYVYQASKHKESESLPAIVFFFGGGWAGRHLTQFIPQSRYLAERGMVAIVADYRVRKRNGVTPFECVADAKSAIRWVRANASELGVDENRIAAGGGSAGGHLAACTALIKDFDEKDEDLNVSSVPNALVLFNAVLNVPEIVPLHPKKVIKILDKRATEISPIHHVYKGAPPTIIFHGTADSNVPFHQATLFCEEMKKYGNRCEVVPFEGREHGFFNYYSGENPDFLATMEETEKFLISIGYLKGYPIKK